MSKASHYVSDVERFAAVVGALGSAEIGCHELAITRNHVTIATAGTVEEAVPSMTLTLPEGTRARDVFDAIVKDKAAELALIRILAALEWVAQRGPCQFSVTDAHFHLRKIADAICKRAEMDGR